MQLVLQNPHADACQQACYAMLARKGIDEIIAVVGHAGRMDVKERERVVAHFGIKMNVWESFPVGAFVLDPYKRLGGLMREHRTLLCSVFDYVDINFAHCVVIHDLQLYDPHAGMNPTWPWGRVIGYAQPVDLDN